MAPSFIIFLVGDKKWVNSYTFATVFTQINAPSMENQTSDKNIMGQLIKLTIPLVNSSFVTRHAMINPRETR